MGNTIPLSSTHHFDPLQQVLSLISLIMSSQQSSDYVIIGGGLAGCVLASRLVEANPSLSVMLLEAGPNEHENPSIKAPLAAFANHNTDLEYNYYTVPQKNLNNRRIYHCGGKVLSGSSAVNYALWTRGDATDD